MTPLEVRLALTVRRANGRDDSTPCIAAALECARRDPVLNAWCYRQERFDRGVAAGLLAVGPPPELRESLLRGPKARVASPAWVWVIAACFALMVLSIGAVLANRARPSVDDLVALALKDLVSSDHVPAADIGEASLATVLTRPGLRVGVGTTVDFAGLAARGCRRLTIGGREVFEICFQRADFGKIHMYIAFEDDFIENDNSREPRMLEIAGRAAATWVNQGRRFVLVADGGARGIRNLL